MGESARAGRRSIGAGESSRGKATTNHEGRTRDDAPPGALGMSAAWLLPSLEHFLRLSVAVYGCAMCV